jgi:hypothetical protein
MPPPLGLGAQRNSCDATRQRRIVELGKRLKPRDVGRKCELAVTHRQGGSRIEALQDGIVPGYEIFSFYRTHPDLPFIIKIPMVVMTTPDLRDGILTNSCCFLYSNRINDEVNSDPNRTGW